MRLTGLTLVKDLCLFHLALLRNERERELEAAIRSLPVVGRKPLNINVNLICDTLRRHDTIAAAAHDLRVSRGYIYKRILNPGSYLNGADRV